MNKYQNRELQKIVVSLLGSSFGDDFGRIVTAIKGTGNFEKVRNVYDFLENIYNYAK